MPTFLATPTAAAGRSGLADAFDDVFGTSLEALFGNPLVPRTWQPLHSVTSATIFPALNVWSDSAALHVEAELPGLRQEDLELTVTGDELVLSGRREELLENGTTLHRRERRTGRFTRSLRLPCEIDADAVTANLVDGVLHVTLPKAATLRPRRIDVQVAR